MGRPLHFETQINRLESERESRQKLETLLSMFSQEINAEASKHGVRNLLDSEGRINMQNYTNKAGGIFNQESIEQDQKELREKQILNSRANITAVQEHYKQTYGIEGVDSIVKKQETLKKEKVGYRAEITLTVLLQKILGKNFWVVRSSEYDDNKFGVDTIIVNKETGEAVCGLDDAVEDENTSSLQGVVSKGNLKRDQVKSHILQGRGGYAKYGLMVNRGQLQRAKMTNLPMFFLGITDSQLKELIHAMQPNSHHISQKEKESFALLVASLKEQLTEYREISRHQILKDKYTQFGEILNQFEQIALQD
ncbi:MAG: hypothetical protein JNN11_04170 [Candidatus Doudnabacteria bacterium]|nr:hypothetical protein [Candidatus Doudnabacteria bacterium]